MTTTSVMPHVWPTVVHMLADAVERAPDAPALICGDETLTYRDYGACVASLARELADLGVKRGDRVALVMGNSLDIAIATFAVQAAGAQVAPLNPAYTASELTPVLADAACHAIIHDDSAAERLRDVLPAFAHRVIAVGRRRLTKPLHADARLTNAALPQPHDLSTLQYTGGTTGRPKGVDLTHHAVSINVSQREALLPTRPDVERILVITPLFHVYAVSMGLYLAAWCRGALVILERYKPDLVFDAIARHRITLMGGSPTIFNGLLASERMARADLLSLTLCYSGSAALAEETLRRWREASGCGVCEGYGQSEAGPVLTFNPVHGARKSGSVGVVVPMTEIDIVDVETGSRSLGRNAIGEIRARGPQVMQGYRGLPDETRQALRNGWLHTGDIGEIDDDGYLFIRDRKKEMAIVGGYNVFPREVEEALFAHPAISEAAVVGVPDAYRGEALIACVVTNDPAIGSDDILAFLATRLVRYKIPREARIVDSLPKTAVGKIDKKILREVVRNN